MATPFDRRSFLRAVVAFAGPVVAGCGDGNATELPRSTPPGAFFPQSVASGDPRPSSVVFWTRVADPDAAGALRLELELALDQGFSDKVELGAGRLSLPLLAEDEADGCVKARVENLAPATAYFYRFAYTRDGKRYLSPTGKTRTAPNPDADVPARFAVLSCQDYAGKYYHVLRHAAEQGLDFVVHLGDYVYETVDDPTFQDPTSERSVRFRNPEEARPHGTDGTRLAARSFGNYCDLYRTYRSDPDLQRLHEMFPMIAVWDDHEFSDDCHGATATYTNGRENEEDLERRHNADRAWFAYMPMDCAEPPASALDPEAAFPDDFRIYRSFVFGRHLELVMTDLRRWKPDHVVPEEAFPGAVFLSEADAVELLGAVPEDALPYVDVDALADGEYRDALRRAAPDLGLDPERIAGLLSVRWINQTLAAAGVAAPAELDENDPSFARGYAYHQLLKTESFASLGARYLVAERPFAALAAKRWVETDGQSERILGDVQRAWFLDALRASTRTWKVWGNEYTLMPRLLDLTAVEFAPEAFRRRIQLSADDWDGAPNERDALLHELSGVENLVVVTGDLHAFFAGTPHPTGDPSARVIELVAGSVSSTPWLPSIARVIESDPSIPPETAALAQAVGGLLQDDDARPNPHIGWLDLEHNGYAVVSVDAETLEATAFTLDDSFVARAPNELTGELESHFEVVPFRVQSGTRELERNQAGVWRRWDMERMAWV